MCPDRPLDDCRPSTPARGRMPRPGRLVLVLAGAIAIGAASPPPPPVQLVETRPVETALGNPVLPEARSAWLDLIGGAKRSLDFEEFYLSTWPGEPLEDVIRAIGAAAKRGVKVRLLLDARMHRTYPQPADSLGKLPGIELRLIDMGRIAGGVQHAKYFLVDGASVYLGSQNLDWRALKHIHELGALVRDRRVSDIFAAVFEMDWEAAGRDSAAGRPEPVALDQHEGLPIRIVQSPGDTVALWPSYSPRSFIPDTTLWDRDAIVRLLDRARHEVVVQLLTYSPEDRGKRDPAIDEALRRAAARGVRVKLLVSDWEVNSPAIRSLQALATVPNVEAKLSTVSAWSGGYIPFARVEHCKYAVVDSQWTWVGTSNWEPGYFEGSRNIAVTLLNRPLALEARRSFETSWNASGSTPVEPGKRYEPKVRGETPPPGMKKYGG